MFVSTRLLKVANSRSLRPLSFVSTLQQGLQTSPPVCLCILPNFSIPIPLYNQNILLWCLVYGFLELLVEVVDLTVIMTRCWCMVYGFLELLVEVVDLTVIMTRCWCINLYDGGIKRAALRRIDISLLETGWHPKTASTTSLRTRNPTPYSCLPSSPLK